MTWTRREIQGQGSGTRLCGDANGEPNACSGQKKGEWGNAKMKVTTMTDAKLKEMIANIQRAGIVVTSDGLRMVIAKSLRDENEAKGRGQGGADEGDSEGEGAAQRAESNYLLAKPRLAGQGREQGRASRAVQEHDQGRASGAGREHDRGQASGAGWGGKQGRDSEAGRE